ncbi:hypothetical protein B0H16DRAFT_371835 [Mycena metata]|uniref:Uncharacterized protein n=1 Tax=Mycena metata TaxID=1033252 RepID=A0AAD7JLU2_9AGAR|nr:hypothetical protein B0H16DRAFT_371835 [Mycena metata]
MDAEHALPLDLEREIFETAALSYPGTRPTLLRVSRRVLVWIEPLLYRDSSIDSPKIAGAIARAMELKPSSFFSGNVRHLHIGSASGWSKQTRYAFLRLCPNLVSLSFGYTMQPLNGILPVLAGLLHVRMWRGSLWQFFGGPSIDASHPFFRTITHMDLLHIPPNANSATVLALDEMPALTHLCLHTWTVDVISGMLRHCSRLQIFLVLLPSYFSKRMLDTISSAITDVRCVVVAMGSLNEWNGWVSHKHDLWAGVEAFVARKRRGEVEISARWVEPWW